MVSYFNAGTQWATQPRATPRASTLTMPAARTSRCRADTTQETGRPSGAPEEVRQQQDQRLVLQGPGPGHCAVVSGKADAMLADSPVVAYAVK